MAPDTKSTKVATRKHAYAVAEAARHFQQLAASGEMPLTPAELQAALGKMAARVESCVEQLPAMELAAKLDAPLPVACYRPWASYAVVRLWAMRKDEDQLPTALLNGKLCVKPSDFFRALAKLGRRAKA